MKIQINRNEFLAALEAVEPGLATRGTMQSDCIVFRAGFLFTFKGEVACRMPTTFPNEFRCAVKGKPLIEAIRRLNDDLFEVSYDQQEFRIQGLVVGKKGQLVKGRRAVGIRCEQKIELPYGVVEKPVSWQPVDEEFRTALSLVAECAGKDESHFALTCLNITPKGVEASDNMHMMRYKVKVPTKKRFLLQKEAARYAAEAGPIKMSQTNDWVHFKTKEGLLLSCRRYEDDYVDLQPHFELHGTPLRFPGGTKAACDLTGGFSRENPDDDKVKITISEEDGILIKGEGVSGWASERFHTKYKGNAVSFRISPKLLVEIVEKHRECEVTSEILRAESGSWVYLRSLSPVNPSNNGDTHDDVQRTGESGDEDQADRLPDV